MAAAVLDGDTGELLEYQHLAKTPKYKDIWENSFGNETGRLAQDMPGRISKKKATNTTSFIKHNETPSKSRRDVTYTHTVCNYCDQKKKKERTCITMGGDRTNFPFECGTPTADLLTIKLLLNSVISTPGGKFMTIDIINFYLNTPMDRYEYMRMKLDTWVKLALLEP